MEATVLSIGRSVLNGVLSYAKSVVAEEVALQLGVRRDHLFITNELEMMQAFLMSAHDEGDDNKVVQVWVKQVRDVAYDVEDSIQDFAVRLEKQSWWRILLLDRRQVAKQMKQLRANVEDISQRNVRYHLIKGSASSNPANSDGQSAIAGVMTMSSTDEARRQREKAKVDLVQLIMKMDERLRVIAVWGKSCDLGEPSIIRRAFEDLKKHKKFDCHAWIKVMCPFNSVEFMRSIIRQFYVNLLQEAPEKANTCAQVLMRMGRKKEIDLPGEFKAYMDERSFLIVIDGLSTIEEWDHIRSCFPNNKRRSRIIASTDQVEVANLCTGPENVAPEHKKLSIDPTLYAFYEKGSQDGDLTEVGSSTTNSTTNASLISVNSKTLKRKETMLAAFKESQLIGRDKEKSDIIQLITDGDSGQFEVISVCGMGGLGKTTVVRDIYQSQELRGKFEKCACVTILRPFNRNELLKNLAEQFGYNDVADMVRHLEGKKCLIILDDLSSTTEWDAIMSRFDAMGTSSRIIVTTRVENIVKHSLAKHETIYKLQGLGLKDAHDLFVQKVFDKTTKLDEQYPELVEQANLILKKCKGLPLAIVTIGGFLANQPKTAIEWRKLNEHISAELQINPELGAIITVLHKSYDGLPYHLKSCFLYLSIFPEDYRINLKRLLRRWVAEGYPGVVRNKSTEEVAMSYFMDLISRSMLLPSQRSFCDGKRIDSCQVHDLIREICISKSIEGNLVIRLEEGCILSTQGTARHLAISSNWERDQGEFESILEISRVRSITVFGEWRSFFISDKMRLLRVLDLEDTTGLVNHDLEHIGKLLHLRYLSLRGCKSICHLPDSLGKLRQLETLDIRGTSIVLLPQTIIKLQKLQNLHAGFPTNGINVCTRHLLHSYGFNQLDACTSLFCGTTTPCIMMDQEYGGVVLPEGTRELKSLRTARGVHLAYGNAVIHEIRRLTGLQKLGVIGVNEKNDVKFCSAISGLSRLESLSVKSDKGCLDDISSPPKNLQSLKLEGRLGVFPEWIKKLQNLVKLKLSFTTSSQVEQNAAMQVLGPLPNLSILRLSGCSFKGAELHFEKDAFRRLVMFDIEGLGSIKSVKFGPEAMPELEQLKVTDACKRGEIGFIGLDILPNIKEVLLSVQFRMDRAGTELEKEARLKDQFRTQLARNLKKPILKIE